MQDFVTFRPRSGFTATIGANAVQAVQIPAGTRQIIVHCTLNAGRVLVGTSDTAPASTATNYGYIGANIPVTIKPVPGRDHYLYLGSTVAANIFYVTFGN